MKNGYQVNDRVVSREDGEHGVVVSIIDSQETFEVYEVLDDNGLAWVAFDDDISPEVTSPKKT